MSRPYSALEIKVALALTGGRWESAMVAALAARSNQVSEIGRCVDVTDLLARAVSGDCGAVLVYPQFPRLDASVVSKLATSGVILIGLVDDESGERRLRQWGIDTVVAVDPIAPAECIPTILSHLAAPQLGPDPARQAVAELPTQSGEVPRGRVVAVWGPAGSPGRTSVAVALGQHAAAQGVSTMIIDADTMNPGVADVLGIRADAAGIIAACRHAEQGNLDVAALARCARAIDPYLRILSGVSSRARRSELRPAALSRMLEMSRTLNELTIIDVGALLDSDEFIAGTASLVDPGASILGQVDVLIAVSSCEPVGLAKLVTAIDRIRSLLGQAQIHAVINRVRPSVVTAAREPALAEFIAEHAGIASVWMVPDCRDEFDAAANSSRTISEQAPKSRAVQAFGRLCEGTGLTTTRVLTADSAA